LNCKNCGAHYRTRELKCPYCDTENIIGKLWKVQRTEAEQEYEAERKKAGRILSPYVADRILSRILVVTAAVGVICTAVCVAVLLIIDSAGSIYAGLNKDKVEKTMETYYNEGRFDELYEYMSKYDLIGSDNYAYSQAALISYDYESYMNDKLTFWELSDEDKAEDTYYLEYAIKNSADVYRLDAGLYSEPDSKNEKLIDEYRKEIMSFWVGTLKLTEEEIAILTKDDYLYYRDLDVIVESVRERRPWDGGK